MTVGRFLSAAVLAASTCVTIAQTRGEAPAIDPSLYQELRYRVIGPFRASRTVGAVGIPTQPNVFFMGVNNGGVWKTDDYGRTWTADLRPRRPRARSAISPCRPPIPTSSTSAAARASIAPTSASATASSSPPTAAPRGSTSASPTSSRSAASSSTRPTPTSCSSPAWAIPTGPTRSAACSARTDGGRTWEKVLYVDHNTGANQVEFDAADPTTLYASLWEHREGPWENASFSGPNSGLYKSIDGGTTWRRLAGGLPTPGQGVGRINFGVAPSDPQRLYAMVLAREGRGVYRSDDGGESWTLVSTRPAPGRRHPRAPAEPGRGVRRPTSRRTDPRTAAAPGPRSRARRAATTTSASGSTRCSPTSCCSRPTRARSSP